MNMAERRRRERLEAILRRHTDREKRTLFELGRAGFDFDTVDEAFAEKASWAVDYRFTQRQIEIAVEAARKATA